MSIIKKTELGNVQISDQLIVHMISEAIEHPDLKGKVWAATERGRQIGLIPMRAEAELASSIKTELGEDDFLTMEFNVIVRFGISIKRITKRLSDLVADNMYYVLGLRPDIITINIAGVKSKQIARRNTKAVFKYGS